jgi:hypothetical protein
VSTRIEFLNPAGFFWEIPQKLLRSFTLRDCRAVYRLCEPCCENNLFSENSKSVPQPDGASPSAHVAPQAGVLRLRGGPRSTQRVVWREDVVDNEGCGKKSSKSMLPPSFNPLPSSFSPCIAHKVPEHTHPLSSLLHIPQTPRI